MKKIVIVTAVCTALVGSAIGLYASGFRCQFCGGTGFTKGGNTNCSMCKGTGRNSDY